MKLKALQYKVNKGGILTISEENFLLQRKKFYNDRLNITLSTLIQHDKNMDAVARELDAIANE